MENKQEDWDDGFIPSGCNGAKGVMIHVPRENTSFVTIREKVLSPKCAKELYETRKHGSTWGVYIPVQDIESLRLKQSMQHGTNPILPVVHLNGKKVHGVSVWLIASSLSDEVAYHIDYAEMLRYQKNIIHPPLYGATLHLTPVAVEGGSLSMNLRGLDHYKTFQYKACRDKLDVNDSNWITVPYVYNRAILFDGDLPHFSSPVTQIPAGHQRVILGMWCYLSRA